MKNAHAQIKWFVFLALLVAGGAEAATSLRLTAGQLVDLVVLNSEMLKNDAVFKNYVDGDKGGEDVTGAECGFVPEGVKCVFSRRDAADDNFIVLPIWPEEIYSEPKTHIINLRGNAAAFFVKVIENDKRLVLSVKQMFPAIFKARQAFKAKIEPEAFPLLDSAACHIELQNEQKSLVCDYFVNPQRDKGRMTLPFTAKEIEAVVGDDTQFFVNGNFRTRVLANLNRLDLAEAIQEEVGLLVSNE